MPLGFLDASERLRFLPVIHGSIDFAVRVREELLSQPYDCVAVPLPATWRDDVLTAVERLPSVSAVVQQIGEEDACTYVPVEPCQPVIAALRLALRERIAIEFVDLESPTFEATKLSLPDPYALKKLPAEKFLGALLPALPRPKVGSLHDLRAKRMAFELHRLELDYKRILFLPGVADWPWVREAYMERAEYPEHEKYFSPIHWYEVDRRTLSFFLGELPFITALYEQARATLDPDEHLAIDGVKQVILEARDRWAKTAQNDYDRVGPKLLQTILHYVRNLTLVNRRLSPDLYTMVVAAKQVVGDGFARSVIEVARDYPVHTEPYGRKRLRMGVEQADVPGQGVCRMDNRLPGIAVSWKNCKLRPEPAKSRKKLWKMLWDPYGQCSHLPEDVRLESFNTHVRDQAKALLGQDLARSEKFTSSIKDGLDVRETLRHWHTGDLYVKELPPTRGGLDAVVIFFDVPADPAKYVWQSTWLNEHAEESVLGLYATNFMEDVIGPGVARARYGGVLLLYPPRDIPDVWSDRRLPRKGPLEDVLIAAAALHAREPHIAVVSPVPLRASWRALARSRRKKLIHLPLSRFSLRTIERLRTVHVLNGKEVRSYASRFIQGD